MKQILQNLETGATEVAEVPCPAVRRGQVLIRSTRTLVSAGTERTLVEFAKAGWIDKARQQPDKVRMVLDKIGTDGLVPAIEAVFDRLDRPSQLGYCSVGAVMDIGKDVAGFSAGERVVSNGKHAEVVSVPTNLCAKVPEGVSDDEAAFTVIGAIGLQGIRLVQPTLGEAVAVTGLGLIGLVTVQLLRAHGCRVLGIDYDAGRLALARRFGAETVDLAAGEDPVAAAQAFSRGRGVDAVLITASTESNEPMHQAALMCRKRGRIVLVGVTGLELSRADFYEKELSFQVSCSYGPGRYDPNYEDKGQDYPVGFVRWTEQRNFEAVLDMMADGRLDVKPLISHRFDIDEAKKAYDLITGAAPSLGILLQDATAEEKSDEVLRRATVKLAAPAIGAGKAVLGFVGSGNYATSVLIPAFKQAGARLKVVASSGGVSGLHAGRKFGFEETTTDTESVFADSQVNAVVITTASCMIRIDIDGNILFNPSEDYEVNRSGYIIHGAIHKARHDVDCIIHTHTLTGMTVASMQCGLLPIAQMSMRWVKGVSYHDYESIVAMDERERMVRDLGRNNVMILRNHGLLEWPALLHKLYQIDPSYRQ